MYTEKTGGCGRPCIISVIIHAFSQWCVCHWLNAQNCDWKVQLFKKLSPTEIGHLYETVRLKVHAGKLVQKIWDLQLPSWHSSHLVTAKRLGYCISTHIMDEHSCLSEELMLREENLVVIDNSHKRMDISLWMSVLVITAEICFVAANRNHSNIDYFKKWLYWAT